MLDEIKNFDKMLTMLGIDQNQDIQSILDQLAPVYSVLLNSECAPKEEGCEWKVTYIDEGRVIKIAKMCGEIEKGYVKYNVADMDVDTHDVEDPDILTMKMWIALSVIL